MTRDRLYDPDRGEANQTRVPKICAQINSQYVLTNFPGSQYALGRVDPPALGRVDPPPLGQDLAAPLAVLSIPGGPIQDRHPGAQRRERRAAIRSAEHGDMLMISPGTWHTGALCRVAWRGRSTRLPAVTDVFSGHWRGGLDRDALTSYLAISDSCDNL